MMHHLDDEAGKTQQKQQRPLHSNPNSNSNRRSNSNAAQPTAMVGLISVTTTSSSSDRAKSGDKTDSLDLGYDSSSFISTTSTTDQSSIISSTGINEKNESLSSDLTSVDSGLDIQDTFSHLSIANSQSSDASYQQETVWLDAFYQDQDGDTHLHLAIIQGYVDAVFALIQLAPHPNYLDIQNDLSQSALHLSVLTRQPLITRRLLLAGANPHTRDRCGNMPLHVACEHGDLETVRQLTVPIAFAELHSSSSSSSRNSNSTNQQRHHRHNHQLHQHRHPVTPPANKTASNLEARNYEGLRCVHIAAIKGHRDVLRHLVAYGANVNAQEDRSGRTALHLAVETRNVHMVELLVKECGADVNALTYSAHSAFQLACGSNAARMTDKLRQLGALPPLNNLSDSSESDSENMDHSDCDSLKMNGGW